MLTIILNLFESLNIFFLKQLTEIVLMVGVGHGRHVVSDARHPGKQIVLDFFH